MRDLPDGIQRIVTTEKQRPRRTWPHVEHIVEYLYDVNPGSISIAVFAANGPVRIPDVGEEFTLHRTPVHAVKVEVSYRAGSDGHPQVYASVYVQPAD